MPEVSHERHVLFVYGSLKRGAENHRWLKEQHFLANAQTGPGYRMYELDGYPGMLRDGGSADYVTGEIWDVTAAALLELDAFEGVDIGLYRRETVVLAPPHNVLTAEAYIFAGAVVGRKLLGHTWSDPC